MLNIWNPFLSYTAGDHGFMFVHIESLPWYILVVQGDNLSRGYDTFLYHALDHMGLHGKKHLGAAYDSRNQTKRMLRRKRGKHHGRVFVGLLVHKQPLEIASLCSAHIYVVYVIEHHQRLLIVIRRRCIWGLC